MAIVESPLFLCPLPITQVSADHTLKAPDSPVTHAGAHYYNNLFISLSFPSPSPACKKTHPEQSADKSH